ncbi:MAG: UvrB/UvrC motif-containing protein, partial [Gammaproteobacteria bacterium]|nr:UvrB/UvrC motif-containing protein [Gammaproteobacteria bacterium]
YQAMTPRQLTKTLDNLEKQMYQHSRDLEFEQAAKVRDDIERIRQLTNF